MPRNTSEELADHAQNPCGQDDVHREGMRDFYVRQGARLLDDTEPGSDEEKELLDAFEDVPLGRKR